MAYAAGAGVALAAGGEWGLALACGFFPGLAAMKIADVVWWRSQRRRGRQNSVA
jgi:hypothetical protein